MNNCPNCHQGGPCPYCPSTTTRLLEEVGYRLEGSGLWVKRDEHGGILHIWPSPNYLNTALTNRPKEG